MNNNKNIIKRQMAFIRYMIALLKIVKVIMEVQYIALLVKLIEYSKSKNPHLNTIQQNQNLEVQFIFMQLL